MIDIKYLADHPAYINKCAEWSFKVWGRFNPNATIEKSIDIFTRHCNKDKTPLTLLAIENNRLIGMASLKDDDGLVSELKPWLASLYVDESLRGKGIAKELVDSIKQKAKELGYKSLYLYVYEFSLKKYYSSLGWVFMDEDMCKGHKVTVMKIDL
jgi:GNAT superfamily N-acetyltransferase